VRLDLVHLCSSDLAPTVFHFRENDARALFGLINTLIMFGGSKDVAYNQEISDLVGTVRVARTSRQSGQMGGRTTSGEDIPIQRPEEIRQLEEQHAPVIAENGKPIIAKLNRCNNGSAGNRLLAGQEGCASSSRHPSLGRPAQMPA